MKNKVAPPFKTVEVDVMYGEGVSKQGEILDLAVEYNIIEKSGSWYSYNGEKLGQGRENAKLFLKENPFVMEEVAELIRAELNIATDTVQNTGLDLNFDEE